MASRVTNSDIAAMFRKLADLLDIEGANPFRVRAYRQAALVIDTLPEPVSEMIARGEDLTKLPWIGKDLAEKIRTIVETGDLPILDEVMRRTPPVLTDLLQVPGLGPRRVEQIYENFGIETLDDLEAALRAGQAARPARLRPEDGSEAPARDRETAPEGPRTALADR